MLARIAVIIFVPMILIGCTGSYWTDYNGGGNYYPSTYSITMYNPYGYSLGYALARPSSDYWSNSGTICRGCERTVYGLTGSYYLDIFMYNTYGSYLGSIYISGSRYVVLDNGDDGKSDVSRCDFERNIITTIVVDDDSPEVIDLGKLP